jgi:hypothetical protein
MLNQLKKIFSKKEKSKTPAPDWDDDELLSVENEQSPSRSYGEAVEKGFEIRKNAARQATSIKYQRRTARVSLWVGIGAIIVSLIIAIGVPIYQQDYQTRSELSALYGTIDANGNIFITNADDMRGFEASDTIANLPDAYLSYPIPNDLQQPLELKLGMVNYTFLLYYEEETILLNQTRDTLNTFLITKGANSPEYKNAKQVYVRTMNYLSEDGWNQTKFNYVADPGCLLYLLQTGFGDSIPASKFDKFMACSNDSLNRIFYWFGYLPPLTPAWMNPLLRDALNARQAGMGNQIIQMDTRE